MGVHLKKLSVGSTSLSGLKAWHKTFTDRGEDIVHATRNWPKRKEELLDGGCMFWIIKGYMLARQPILDLRAVQREDGHEACGIILAPTLIPVWPKRMSPFQGWRYLAITDAPKDMPKHDLEQDQSAEFLAELHELGLL